MASPNGSRTFSQDLLASVVVFLVALPLCMGIAIASGAPPAAGLITGIIGGLLVGMIQGSPLQVSGPAAGLVVIIAQLIQDHGFAAIGTIVIAAGVIQMIAAALRGGRWFRAVPPSVIYGMLAGIGVLILAGQFHVMVDDRPKASGLMNLASIPEALWKIIASDASLPHQEAAVTGIITIIAIVLWNRVPGRLRLVPGALVGVVIATVIATVFAFPIAYVSVPDSLLSSVALPTTETLQLLTESTIWGAALVLATVASAETLLCATAVDRMHAGPRTNYNRELFAQGIGNTICGLVGALPMTGVIVRSSANVQAGGRTRLAAILHGGWILVLVAVFPQVLRLVPVGSLAGILVYTGYKLINPAAVRLLAKYGKTEVAIYLATVVSIVSLDLLKGVLIGFALSICNLLYRMSHLEISVDDDVEQRRAVLHLRGSATFLRIADIAEALDQLPSDRELHIRFDDLDHLDHAALELLTTWEKQHASKGGSVVVDWNELDQRYHSPKGTRADSPPRDP